MNPLNSVAGTITAGIVLAIVIAAATAGIAFNAVSFIVWIHVLAGITWIGLLYYFNFVQVPALAEAIADEGGPGGAGITKYVAPRALWWFRWGAMFTFLTGLVLLWSVGALGSLNFFSLEKFMEDCERERRSKQVFEASPKDRGVIPMYFPADNDAMAGIREIAEKGNPKSADHTLKNVDSFRLWESAINAAARKKIYYPQLNDTVIEIVGRGEMIP